MLKLYDKAGDIDPLKLKKILSDFKEIFVKTRLEKTVTERLFKDSNPTTMVFRNRFCSSLVSVIYEYRYSPVSLTSAFRMFPSYVSI